MQLSLTNLYITEEQNMLQKCKVQWLKGGDENSRFYHWLLAARRRKAIITDLKDGQGNSLLNNREIEKEVIGFFEALYLYDEALGFCLVV